MAESPAAAPGRGVWPALVAFGAAAIVEAAGGLATTLTPWYHALRKPGWSPPDWLFGPAWTVIFALIALSGLLAWRHSRSGADRTRLALLFGMNAMLNIAWSVLFFRLQRPDWALVEVGLLWLSIAVLVAAVGARERRAAWLLLPYLAWVSFAATVNLGVVELNPPFG